MAEHFPEAFNSRLRVLEARVHDEVEAVKEHFEEQRRFITEQLAAQDLHWRREFQQLRKEIQADIAVLLEHQRAFTLGLDRLLDGLDRLDTRAGRIEKLLGHRGSR